MKRGTKGKQGSKRQEGSKEGKAISGSLELGREARKAISVEVANPQTSKSWKRTVHEKISAAGGCCAFCMVISAKSIEGSKTTKYQDSKINLGSYSY